MGKSQIKYYLFKKIHKLLRWGEVWNGPIREEEKKSQELRKKI